MRFMVTPGQTVFARWRNGYYYPAVVDEVLGNDIQVSYLDGDTGPVAKEHVMELQEAFEVLNLQGNWKHGGFFFKGEIASQEPLTMHYNDGGIEQIELVQLRGKPVKPTAVKACPPKSIASTELEKLKTLHKTGLISKEEFKRRKKLLR